MKSYTLEIEQENVAEKVICLLKHFKDEGITIKENYSVNQEVKNSITQAVNEMNMIKKGKIEAKPIEDLLNAL